MQPHPHADTSSNPTNSLAQYRAVVSRCRELFRKKTQDYGTSWRVLRPISLVDQVYIKAWRIRQIQEGIEQRVEDPVEGEFIGIVNYGIIALVQETLADNEDWDLPAEDALARYDAAAAEIEALMLRKNHDYGEAWRAMCEESFVDLILTKLLRLKQIIANDGKTVVSEGPGANFSDIVNYGIFALIKLSERQTVSAV